MSRNQAKRIGAGPKTPTKNTGSQRDWTFLVIGLLLGTGFSVLATAVYDWYQRPRLAITTSARYIEHREGVLDGKSVHVYMVHDAVQHCHQVVAAYEKSELEDQWEASTTTDWLFLLTNSGKRDLEHLRLPLTAEWLIAPQLIRSPNIEAYISETDRGPDGLPKWVVEVPRVPFGRVAFFSVRQHYSGENAFTLTSGLHIGAPTAVNLEMRDATIQQVPAQEIEVTESELFGLAVHATSMGWPNAEAKQGELRVHANAETVRYEGIPMCPKGQTQPLQPLIMLAPALKGVLELK
jgi:hypothetical protein